MVDDSTVVSLLRARMYRNSADTFTNLDEIRDRIKDILIRACDMGRILYLPLFLNFQRAHVIYSFYIF